MVNMLSKITTSMVIIAILILLNVMSLINSSVHDFLYKGLSSVLASSLLNHSPTNKLLDTRKKFQLEKNKLGPVDL